MDLHRTDKKPEWEYVSSPNELNFWQRIAAPTKGAITPGNIASLIGLGLVMSGRKSLKSGDAGKGIVKVGLGRICDIIDGKVADMTKTKSPLGETVDVVVDKIEMAALLPVFYRSELAPKPVILTYAAQQVINSMLTGIALVRHNEIHPTRESKLATGGIWGSLGFYTMAKIAKNHDSSLSGILDCAASVSTAATGYMMAKSLPEYFNDAFSTEINLEEELITTQPQHTEDNV